MTTPKSINTVEIDGQTFTLPRRGIISISRLDFGVLSIYITPEMQVTSRAVTEGAVADLCVDLANFVSGDAWVVDEINKQPGGSYQVRMVAL